jgi:hypothetical protein
MAQFGVNDTVCRGARGRGCADVGAAIKAVPPRWLQVRNVAIPVIRRARNSGVARAESPGNGFLLAAHE